MIFDVSRQYFSEVEAALVFARLGRWRQFNPISESGDVPEALMNVVAGHPLLEDSAAWKVASPGQGHVRHKSWQLLSTALARRVAPVTGEIVRGKYQVHCCGASPATLTTQRSTPLSRCAQGCIGGHNWFGGAVTRAHNDGTFDLRYDDGDAALLKVPEQAAQAA